MKNKVIALVLLCSLCACMKEEAAVSKATADTGYSGDLSLERSEEESGVSYNVVPNGGTTLSDDKFKQANANVSNYISSSAAKVSAKDSNRKFVRTANLRFRVKNVTQATYVIEDIVLANDGFVTFTNLQSRIDFVENTPISKDSTLESTHYTVENRITIRVPNSLMDTTLKQISLLVDYLDYRVIKAEDVSLQILGNQLNRNRLSRHERHLRDAIQNRGRKLQETVNAEEGLLMRGQQSDEVMISNLNLKNQVDMSTITLDLYQKQAVQRELVFNGQNIEAYQPSFGSQIVDAFSIGLYVLQSVILFFMKIWWLILLSIVGFLVWNKFTSRLRK